ncbi:MULTISPECIES: MazG-like family protein [Rodentibacter]|uniref:Uncharacterized protein n=3 Tax=Rodentibacter pneumotropicus TaxID=758 RepID=A0A4S2QJ45_9PAST|nr:MULTISPECIES: MazG-like family protein [Pasteurellaceae]TGY50798.1 hypothetical protein E5343_00130 [Pasteurella caecimuris]TGZ98146.1 hypothetical protein D3M79_10430 [Rodentibacter pneumotropicus]THA08165.1 hypothetical protein D3M78_08100 [Rodentibacter pneumotropicus]THA09144.1 hypothetical protein D3M77_02895 [Rodentibacter pneumotropicus]THA17291.1 hypothetical protein D3M76_01980 [Rodentibacter pneumotropicus]
MADLKQLIKNIEQWAEDRNLIEGSTPQKQFIKLMEEFGELCGGISKNNIEQIKDSIGDCEVVLIILNKQLNCKINFEDAINNFSIKGEYSVEDYILDFSIHISDLAYSIAHLESKLGSINIEKSLLRVFGSILSIADYKYLGCAECLKFAYNQIKDRKGKMIDGVFVKEGDLRRVGRSKLLGASYGNK